jgi:hypothetical protein
MFAASINQQLESLNLDEAVLLDNFYRSNITPLFFVECLADLEKAIRSRSTSEQLVGSLALRTPESQSCATAHHTKVLRNELARKFDLTQVTGEADGSVWATRATRRQERHCF